MGSAKWRVMKRRVILESYDFEELCVNHTKTTPTFTNDHTQFLEPLDVFLNWHERVIFDVTPSRQLWWRCWRVMIFFYNFPFSRFWRSVFWKKELILVIISLFCSGSIHFTLVVVDSSKRWTCESTNIEIHDLFIFVWIKHHKQSGLLKTLRWYHLQFEFMSFTRVPCRFHGYRNCK